MCHAHLVPGTTSVLIPMPVLVAMLILDLTLVLVLAIEVEVTPDTFEALVFVQAHELVCVLILALSNKYVILSA